MKLVRIPADARPHPRSYRPDLPLGSIVRQTVCPLVMENGKLVIGPARATRSLLAWADRIARGQSC